MTDDGMMRLADFNGLEMITRPLAKPGWSELFACGGCGWWRWAADNGWMTTLSSWIRGTETCLP
jgi:hypothetical protein